MKKVLRILFINLSKIVMYFFYDRNYLKGRHFDNNVKGWIWCWKNVFMQKVIGYNRNYPFPVSFRSEFGKFQNISFHIDDINNFQHFGCYFQSWRGKITIGKGTYIAPNVGIITENHDINNLDKHLEAKNIKIGNESWIGMNSVILPGVELGPKTIVGAGAVVTKSFPKGNCVLGGTPAKEINKIKLDY